MPEGLVLPRRDLDIAVVLNSRHELVDEQPLTDAGVIVLVVAVGGLGRIDVPGRGRIEGGGNAEPVAERAGGDGAVGLSREVESVFVNLLVARVVGAVGS